jgi:hypothetical protein
VLCVLLFCCPHTQVVRLEPSRRYLLTSTRALTAEEKAAFAALVHDRMTEQVGGDIRGAVLSGRAPGKGQTQTRQKGKGKTLQGADSGADQDVGDSTLM